jgi:Zn-finger nucleic acid-binding protein
MTQYERNGITIDQCTECRGIFLDRGELERLIDAESSWVARQQQPAQPAPTTQPGARPRYKDYDSDEYPVYGHPGQGHPRKKRGGFLSELFD